MNTNFEPVMSALLSWWQSTVTLPFTANAAEGSAIISGVSSFTGLFAGLPLVGPGVVPGATILSIDQGASEVMLSDPVEATVTDSGFTAGFLSMDRRIPHWSQVSEQPFLGLRRIGATDHYSGDLSITTLECEAWIYCNAGQDPDVPPDTGLTNLEQLVRQSLAPDDDNRFTLGGLVYWCRIEGRTDSSPGDQGGQAISRLPIRITLP